jgi:hypothetical protein
MRRFNFRVFAIAAVALSIAAFFCFVGVFEARGGKVADIGLRILSFPVITIISKFDLDFGFDGFLILIFLNSLLYGLLVERIFTMLNREKKKATAVGAQESKFWK